MLQDGGRLWHAMSTLVLVLVESEVGQTSDVLSGVVVAVHLATMEPR